MNKLLLLFCEGQDEPPYIRRVLKVDGWKNYTDQDIEKYPDIIKEYLVQQLQKSTQLLQRASGGNSFIWTRKNNFLPFYILKKGAYFILIFKVGGTSKYDALRSCIFGFKNRINIEPSEIRPTLHVGFFYDADISIKDRIEVFKNNMKMPQQAMPAQLYLPNYCTSLLEDKITESNYFHSEKQKDNLAAVGLFIFHEQGKGALEELLLPIMRMDEGGKNNTTLFQETENYINTHFDQDRPKKREDITPLKIQAEKNKALIGITGQLQRPGRTNSVIITDSDYISEAKINTHTPSLTIVKFIQQLFS